MYTPRRKKSARRLSASVLLCIISFCFATLCGCGTRLGGTAGSGVGEVKSQMGCREGHHGREIPYFLGMKKSGVVKDEETVCCAASLCLSLGARGSGSNPECYVK
uniref:Putative secreted protein n=1 Tax=Amblyomma triste TaxID=251400 RepID=A0A023G426_AMBTT